MRAFALAAAGAATIGAVFMLNKRETPPVAGVTSDVTIPQLPPAKAPEPAKAAGKVPVGIANNNPLNLRDYGIVWQGNTGRDSRGLEMFDTAENGLRAAGNDMKNKWLKGINTIRELVSEWAPANGQAQDGTKYTNPTESYIKRVSQLAGIGENVELLSAAQYMAVVKAMIVFENGQNPYSDSFIKKWFFVGMRHGVPLPFYFEMDDSYGK